MARPQTIVKEQYSMEKLEFRAGLSDEIVAFQVYGTTPDHTYEDRDVYFDMSVPYAHLRGEDAIALGQALIKHGTNALKANMYQHQHIHHMNTLKRFIADGLVEKLIFKVVDESPANYGKGCKTYVVKPVWANEPPEYNEDFEFETIVYWSPFEEEYNEQIGFWEVPIEFDGYDREQDIADFNKEVEEYEANAEVATAEEIDAHVVELAAGMGLTIEEVKGVSVGELVETAKQSLVQSVRVPAEALEQTNEGSKLGKGCTDPIRYNYEEPETPGEAESHAGGIAGYPVNETINDYEERAIQSPVGGTDNDSDSN